MTAPTTHRRPQARRQLTSSSAASAALVIRTLSDRGFDTVIRLTTDRAGRSKAKKGLLF